MSRKHQDKASAGDVLTSIEQIPFHSLERIGAIFDEGAVKHGRDNWKKGAGDEEYQRERLKHALRHLHLWADGDRAEDHLPKVAWFCVTQMELERLEAQGKTATRWATSAPEPAARRKPKLSKEGRERIAAAQRKRWAEARREAKKAKAQAKKAVE